MEENTNNRQFDKNFEREYKNLAKNSFYSFFHNYSGFIFSIITSFIMARIITQETWGFLIVSLSFIAIFTLTFAFLPPDLGLSYNYYIPRYRALKQNTKLKSFLKKSLIIRLLFIIPTSLVSLLIIYILINIFSTKLGNFEYLLLLLSPLVIINGLNPVFNDILRSFNLFKKVYFFLIIRYSIHIGGLLVLLLNPKLVNLPNISIIIVSSLLVPSLLKSFIILRLLMRIEETSEDKLTFKQVFKILFKYGSKMSIKTYLDKFKKEFKTILVGSLGATGTVTGFNIGVHYSDVSYEAIGSFNRPLTISFSSLSAKKQTKQIEAIYKNLFQYTLFLILIITGFLYFVVDIYLYLIYSNYSESFGLYSIILKILVISMIFNIQASFFYSLLRASDKVSYFIPISIISFFIHISLFILGLQFFGIIGAVLGVTLSNFIFFIILAFLNIRIFKFKIDFTRTILMYLIFFCSLGFSLLLESLFFNEFNRFILLKLNLTIFSSFNFFSLVFFLLIFLFFIFILGIFSLSDIESLELIFNRENFLDKTIRKILNFLKKFVRP
ncbi:hypothetical protein LCGC14_1637210 [marine sediment metagenome]|uniref:Uncharacterized protein n=1 Tax=marine sediment metagenome TaxID=412755 RepID=A0A0F9KGH6_9ZZZZ